MVKKEIIVERAQKCSEYLDQLEKIVSGIDFKKVI